METRCQPRRTRVPAVGTADGLIESFRERDILFYCTVKVKGQNSVLFTDPHTHRVNPTLLLAAVERVTGEGWGGLSRGR